MSFKKNKPIDNYMLCYRSEILLDHTRFGKRPLTILGLFLPFLPHFPPNGHLLVPQQLWHCPPPLGFDRSPLSWIERCTYDNHHFLSLSHGPWTKKAWMMTGL